MQDEKVKRIQQRFNYIFEKWRTCTKSSKQPLSQSEPLSEDLLNDIISDVSGLSADVQRAYDGQRQLTPTDQETRRKVDICVQVSNFIVSKATSYVDAETWMPRKEEQDWPDVGSLFQSTVCKSCTSEHSNKSSVKHQEAAAEAAASQAVLKVFEEQEIEQIEIERLEAEALQRSLDERKRKLQHLEKVKDLRAAQARMQVYDQISITEEQEVVISRTSAENKNPRNAGVPPQQEYGISQTATTPANDGTAELVKALAGALNASRIPVPEPSIFTGDALTYSDWKLSFHTLIE